MKRQSLFALAAAFCLGVFAQIDHQRVYSTFDNLSLAKADTFNNGADASNGFTHYGRYWNNDYNAAWSSWSGWALSNMTDTITAGYDNQYSAIAGSGVSGTSNYMVSTSNGAFIKLDEAIAISGAYFTNATYTARDMEQGSGFSKKFGGVTGDDPDFLRVIISSYLANEFVDSTIFYLADYRSEDNSKDYILKDWTFVDFNNDLENDFSIDSISFRYEGSDVGEFGLNTPAYLCMDDFNAVSAVENGGPFISIGVDTFYNGSDNSGGINDGYLFFNSNYNSDWNSWSGWALSSKLDNTTAGFGNQYSCINTEKPTFFLAGGQQTEIRSPYLEGRKDMLFKTLRPAPWPMSISVTNSAYAALDMENGSGFSKKFGGDSGDDADFFRLLINYVDAAGSVLRTDTTYLADFRFANNSQDFILKDWKEIKSYGDNENQLYHKIKFSLESSDIGNFGMNTPAYFCLTYNFDIASVEQFKSEVEVNAFPNPAEGEIHFAAEEAINKIQIIGMDGRVLIDYTPEHSTKNLSVDLSLVTSGVYFAVVYTDKGIATKKFIKK